VLRNEWIFSGSKGQPVSININNRTVGINYALVERGTLVHLHVEAFGNDLEPELAFVALGYAVVAGVSVAHYARLQIDAARAALVVGVGGHALRQFQRFAQAHEINVVAHEHSGLAQRNRVAREALDQIAHFLAAQRQQRAGHRIGLNAER
jgi:hypothetical protein